MRRRRRSDPPEDTSQRDRSQFLALRRLQAQSRGKSFHDKQVIDHARIEWDRKQNAEKRKKSRTRDLESAIPEPSLPNFVDSLAGKELVRMIFSRIDVFLAEILKSRFLEGDDIQELAAKLGCSHTAARSAIRKAIRAARSVPTP